MTTLSSIERLVVTDLETFGLNPESDPILEIGFMLVDNNLEVIDTFSVCVWDLAMYSTHLARLRTSDKSGDKFVMDMHTKSGLWDAVRRSGVQPLEAERLTNQWLQSHDIIGGFDPLVGSSVQFDRAMLDAQMGTISRRFSYRNIDVSTIKELCRRFNPVMYQHLATDVPTKKSHRVVDDMMDTLAELKWYRDNFLFVSDTVLDEDPADLSF